MLIEECSELVKPYVKEVICHHPDLTKCRVTIDWLLLEADKPEVDPDEPQQDLPILDESAVKMNRRSVAARVRIVGYSDRAKNNADAEVRIDKERWENMSEQEKEALIDQQLYQIVVRFDKESNVIKDNLGRPKLKIRKPDFRVEGFKEIVKRHKGRRHRSTRSTGR